MIKIKKNIILFFLLLFIFTFLSADQFNITKQEIEQFLSFADKYLEKVDKFLTQEEKKLKLDEIVYLENEKIYQITDSFLKSNGWDFEKMGNFLYVTSLVLNSLYLWEQYNLSEEEQVIEDVSQNSIILIKKYKQKLLKYITILEFEDNENLGENNMVEESRDSDELSNFIGKYKMQIINNPRFGFQDEIIIKNIKNNKVEGEVVIDWDIGPQARLPMPWEGTYSLSFTSTINKNNLKFSVVVAENYEVASKYEFDLYLEKEKSKPIIRGNLKIIVIKSKYTENYSIKAEKK